MKESPDKSKLKKNGLGGLTKTNTYTTLNTDSTFDLKNKMKELKELKGWMIKNDKTIREVAAMIDIHFTTLDRLIRGKNIPYDRTAYKIKEFLKKQKVK